MKDKIFNRTAVKPPEDGWYQIEVSGTHSAGKDRKQLIDQKAMESIVNRFHGEREKEGEDYAGMLVDIDHRSHDLANTTEAWAWLHDLAIRNGQLWGKLDVTDLGEPAIRNKRVKWFSTEYDPEDLEEVEPGVVRPLRLAGLAFTNRPNNRGGKPISNREEILENQKPEIENMKAIAELLGLPADADETAILAQLTEFMSVIEANKAKATEEEAVAIMNRYAGRIPKEKEADVKERLIRNRADTVAMLELLPEPVKVEVTARIHNRDGATTPDPVGDGKDAEAKEAERKTFVEGIKNREKCTNEQAWNLARREKPELFGN